MYSSINVGTRIAELNASGIPKPDRIRQFAPMTVGWPYVFGAWGEECNPANRRKRARDDHPTIVSACPVLNGSKMECDGCKWALPVRMFDCRGFTKWTLEQVGITIKGGGCTSQWNDDNNWVIKGSINEMPKDKICCIFTGTANKKEHTGLYLGDGSTIECSSGVQMFKQMKSKWKYYAIPRGLYDDIPDPDPGDKKPTLRKGDRGPYVTLAQTELINKGYSCGSSGADGIFGNDTLYAVKKFQMDNGLTVDGVIGAKTWAALDGETPTKLYTVHIPHKTKSAAEALILDNAGAWMSEE